MLTPTPVLEIVNEAAERQADLDSIYAAVVTILLRYHRVQSDGAAAR
jgi:hypothetical protein